ncbi:MAG: hypothetical protein IPM60_01545 [Rhodospirillales bacterium]|nr:hypothetical protein [Rhodospirillales bacterium]
MSIHRYGADAVIADYARSGAGLAITLGPLVAVPTAPAATVLLGLGAAVFALFGGTTVVRHLTRIEVDDDGVHVRGPRGGDVAWRSLRAVRLAYYSTRRDGGNGWLQLTLHGGRRRLRVDSRIADFHGLATRAAAAAGAQGVALDAATAFNFRAMGIATAAAAPGPAPVIAMAASAE